MTSSNVNAAKTEIIAHGTANEMRAYDRLPLALREALRKASINISAIEVEKFWLQNAENVGATIRAILYTQEQNKVM